MLDFIRENFMHVMPILLAGAFAVALMTERARTLYLKLPMANPKAFLQEIAAALQGGKTDQALAVCERNADKPLAQLARIAVLRAHLPEDFIYQGLGIVLSEQVQRVQKRTAYISMIANVATLLGLFGTIVGLIHSFEAVGHADPQQKATLLANGISTAMNATMLGLGVAIPCMVAFSLLTSRANQLIAELDEGATRLADLIKIQAYVGEDASRERISA